MEVLESVDVKSVEVLGVDKGTGCQELLRRASMTACRVGSARVDCFTSETVIAFGVVWSDKNAIYSSAWSDAVEGWVVARGWRDR